MKLKTILGVIACAGACASFSAFANTTTNWFEVVASSKTATGVTITTNNAPVLIQDLVGDGTKIALDNDEETPLVFLPGSVPATSDGLVTITATAELTPSSTNDLVEITGAKAGFAVGIDENNVSNFFGYANGAWIKLTSGNPDVNPDTVKVDGETTFSIVLDYRTNKVKYYLGECATLLTAAEGGASEFTFGTGSLSLTSVDAWGTGSIASVGTVCEVAVAEVAGKRYGSMGEAVNAATEAGIVDKNAVAVVNADGTSGTAGAVADNGLKVWECEALGIDTDEQITLAKSTKQNANKITLRTTNTSSDDSVTVKYQVNGVGSYDLDDIQIPMTTGIYTITPVITGK